jgi:hypothetical protein
LLLQQDDGSWERVDLEGEVATGMGFDAVLFDRDRDGDLDVYVVNDMGADFGGNVLWENQGGTLTDASEACGCDAVMSGMGVDVGDHDGDGQPDLYLSATGRNLLYQADGDWLYADVGQSTGADPFEDPDEMSWGAVFLDYDNDGLPDILVAQGDQWHGEDPIGVVGDLPIALLGQTPGGTYEHRAAELGMDLQGSWRAVVAVDHNGDGVLDPLVTDVTEQPRLFLSTGCTRNGWLEVEAPPMARVEICAGGARQVAWATTESSWGGARPPVVHFGLGDADRVDRLAIELLDGTVTYVDEPFEARRSVRVVP